MPIATVWDDTAKTIIRLDYDGSWEWDDYDRAIDQAIEMAAATPQRVDLIINTIGGNSPPRGNSLWHIRRAMRLSPANMGITVTVGVRQGSFFQSTIMGTVFKLFPKAAEHAAFTPTVDEARVMIAAQRERQKPSVAARG